MVAQQNGRARAVAVGARTMETGGDAYACGGTGAQVIRGGLDGEAPTGCAVFMCAPDEGAAK